MSEFQGSASGVPALVVFDMAGTTVEDTAGVVAGHLCDALAAANFDVPVAEVNPVMGFPKDVALRALLMPRVSSETEREKAVAAIHADFLSRINHYYASSMAVRAVPGAEQTFQVLRAAGIKVALDTGFGRATADTILRRLGWSEQESLLDAVITSDEAPRGRPYPDMIYLLMERLGVTESARVAKIGDTPSDLQQGAAAGCGWVIGVTSGTHTCEALLPYPHTHLLHSVADLPAAFGLPTPL